MKLLSHILATILPNTEAQQIEPFLTMAELLAKAAGGILFHEVLCRLMKITGSPGVKKLLAGQHS